MLEVPADICDRVASASELQVASVPVLEHPIIRDDDECVTYHSGRLSTVGCLIVGSSLLLVW